MHNSIILSINVVYFVDVVVVVVLVVVMVLECEFQAKKLDVRLQKNF